MMANELIIYTIDDEELLRESTAKAIEMFIPGSSVQKFHHGDGLCGLIGGLKKDPDVIFMDTEMSVKNPRTRKIIEKHMPGYEVCEAIRQEYGPGIKIIGMSAQPEYKPLWLNAGANGFFSKCDSLIGFMRNELPKYLEKK